MSEVKSVIVELRGPAGERLGRTTEGYYVVNGDALTMTFADGRPVTDSEGIPAFQRSIKPDDYPPAIACALTHKVRRFVMGVSEESEAFNRPITYQNMGVA
jgi:hypothetical protein